MIKSMNRMVAVAVAAGMAFTPIAAAANTRAADTSAVYSAPSSAPGKGRSAKGEKLVAPGILIAILSAAAATAAILAATGAFDDDDDNQSPGGN